LLFVPLSSGCSPCGCLWSGGSVGRGSCVWQIFTAFVGQHLSNLGWLGHLWIPPWNGCPTRRGFRRVGSTNLNSSCSIVTSLNSWHELCWPTPRLQRSPARQPFNREANAQAELRPPSARGMASARHAGTRRFLAAGSGGRTPVAAPRFEDRRMQRQAWLAVKLKCPAFAQNAKRTGLRRTDWLELRLDGPSPDR